MSVKVTHGEAAVDQEYFYRSMDTAPQNVRILLLNPDNVACLGTYNGRDTYWRGWSPLPRIKRPEK